jgi:hypothetical protein
MGLTWEPVGQGMTDLQSSFIRGLAAHPSGAIFTASAGGGVYRSMNDGDDWMRVYGTQGSYNFLGAIAVREDGTVFLGENDGDGGIFMSMDEGESWNDITNGMDDKDITCIAFNMSNDIYIGTTQDGIYRSVTNGQSWSPVGTSLDTYEIRDIAINSQGHVYVTASEGVWKTTDNSNWDQVGSAVLGTSNRPIEINIKDHIFVGLQDLWVSRDDGFTWLQHDQGLESWEINDLVLNMEEHLFAGTYHGVFRTFEPTTAVSMKFTVKMKNEDGFNPATQSVVVNGSFNNWGDDGEWILVGQEDADLTYTGTFSIMNPYDFINSDILEYKFAISTNSGVDDDIWELFEGNRMVLWDGNDNLDIDPVWFSNQKDFTLMSTSTIVVDGTDSRGVAWADYNNDGFEDVIITDDGSTSRNDLFHNNGDGTFTQITSGSPAMENGNSRTAVWGDYDNDGFEDLYITNLHDENNFLYKNNGDGGFTHVTESETALLGGYSVSSVWADFDNDGYLDLFVANSGGNANSLFMNNQDGTFMSVSGQSLVTDLDDSRGCAVADFDNDGDVDIFIANSGDGENNSLYKNDEFGVFSKVTTGPVVNDGALSSGGSWGDYNNDGWLDLYVTHKFGIPNMLYKNDGKGGFSLVGSAVLPEDSSSSYGSSWIDYDNDGLLDLYVANRGPKTNFLYKQRSDGNFVHIVMGPLVEDPNTDSHGAAWADFNNDGYLDLLQANNGGSNALYRNNISGNHFIRIKLIGTLSNKSALGAKVIAYYKNSEGNPTAQRRDILSQTGFLGQNSTVLTFGIGQAVNIDSLIIHWPGGRKQSITEQFGIDQMMYITESNPNVVPPAPILNIPQNGATNIVINPMLNWNSAGDATQYHLIFADNASFAPLMFEDSVITEATVYDVNGLERGNTYYWQVRAKNDVGWGPWSQAWSFTTTDSIPQVPPPVTILNTPANESQGITVSPSLTWFQAGDASQYHLIFANNSIFNPVLEDDSVVAKTSYDITGLQYDQPYYWKVRAKNEAGWGSWSDTWSFTTQSFSGTLNEPVLVSPQNEQQNVPIPAPMRWSSQVTGRYNLQISEDDQFTNLVTNIMDITDTLIFVDGGVLDYNTSYYWRVNITVSGDTSPWSIPHIFTTLLDEIDAITEIPFPEHERRDDFSSTDYLMVGLPGNADVLFRDIFGSGAGEDWMAYWDNGKSGNPSEYFFAYDGSDIFKFRTGQAFWVISNGSINVNRKIPVASLNEYAQAEVVIHEGWNMITSPFSHRISWQAVKWANNIMADIPLWRYNRSTHTFTEAAYLEPMVGFYFDNPAASRTILLIPYIDPFPKPIVYSDLNWESKIELSAGDTKGAIVRFGARPDAEVGIDESDYRKPRAFADLADIYFKRPDWDDGNSRFGSDVRPPVNMVESWDFEVYTPQKTEADLYFPGIDNIPEEFEVYLIDKTRQTYQDLRDDNQYDFVSTTRYSKFEIVVGDPEVIEEKLSAIIPLEYALGKNYPNPFNPKTIINYELPITNEVELSIYNLIGQKVQTLVSGRQQAGYYQVEWDATGFSSGVYFYHLQAGGHHEVRKMVLLK